MAFNKSSPHSCSLQEGTAVAASLEPAHPRPATFTSSVNYMPPQEKIFPSGYQPPSFNLHSYARHSRETTGDTSLSCYGKFPVSTRCSNCHEAIVTSITYTTGSFTWMVAATLLLFGCCLAPFCINSCKDVIHSCPRCEHVLGAYYRTFKGSQVTDYDNLLHQ